MRKREFALPVEKCPLCGSEGTFSVRGRIDDIPYFGEIMETLALCTRCGFRQSDVMQTESREPRVYEFEITSEDDMKVRVVKSSTGVIKIPELEVVVKPGPASQGYVSNVEGVLDRVMEAMRIATQSAGQEGRRRGRENMDRIERIKRGEERAKLIILDPKGNSAIVDGRATVKPLQGSDLDDI
ncbi:MAG: ZPR1 zinc finger domain-containing protein [Candidatus Hadarchaeales archaeon]